MDFAGVAARLPEDASLETRIKMLRQAAGEDFRVYDFNEYDGLGAGLDEDSANELNDETFGADAESIGQDFDFGGGSAAHEKTESKKGAKSQAKPAPSAWDQPKIPGLTSSFNALDFDPLLGSQILETAPSQAFDQQQYVRKQHQQQNLPPNQPQPVNQALTLEDIEGDIQYPTDSTKPTASTTAPLSIEELEAQMFMEQQAAQKAQSVPPPHVMQGPHNHSPSISERQHSHANQIPPVNQQLYNNRYVHGNQIVEQPQFTAPEPQSMVTTFYPPLPTSETPSIPPPVPFISTQQRLAAMRVEAQQLRMLRDNESIERLRFLEAQIDEQEKLEEKRRRKGKKIAEMAKYNGLMSQSDKDFITRIQVSQLVKSVSPDRSYDPYADDFYFHVFSALRASRSGGQISGTAQNMSHNGLDKLRGNHERTGSIVKPDRRLTRRENAMVRMAQQVQRIVEDAKKRQGPVNLTIEGALGRKMTRVGSTPRQTIQVHANKDTDNIGENLPLLNEDASSQSNGPPLTRHEALLQTEHVFEIVLELEQMRRTQPQANGDLTQQSEKSPEELEKEQEEEKRRFEEWDSQFKAKLSSLWDGIQINVPLDYSVPHPFISILSSSKGKKLLPRVVRHADSHITLTILTLLLATFDSLDIVKKSPILDTTPPPNSSASFERAQVENDTDTFLKSTFPVLMTTIGTIPLRIVTGMVGLILKRTDPAFIAKSRPGIAVLTVLLARAESLKHGNEGTTQDEFNQWGQIFAALFATLSGSLVTLFPSHRQNNTEIPRSDIDQEDASIWQFLAALAVSASATEQQSLIGELREKILAEVTAARSPTCTSEISATKLANVNFLLQSLGLDASLIT